MRQTERKKKKDKVAAVLMLCFCLIALTSIFTIKASIDKITGSGGNVPVDTPAPVEQQDDVSKPEEEQSREKDESSTASVKVPTVDSRKETPKTNRFQLPIDEDKATVSKAYSMDMVIYNETLDQYMTHPGVDVQAGQGTAVKAIADGTITDIYTDDAYGITIEITHSNGYLSRYCCLATGKLAEKGDSVKQGQVISNVGQTALYESMEPVHLHLEMEKNGTLVDPAKYIRF